MSEFNGALDNYLAAPYERQEVIETECPECGHWQVLPGLDGLWPCEECGADIEHDPETPEDYLEDRYEEDGG